MLFWLGLGIGWGGLLGLTQWWTVQQLEPKRPFQTLGLVLAGFVGRWLLTAVLLLQAIGYGVGSVAALLIGLWLVRWMLLSRMSQPQMNRDKRG